MAHALRAIDRKTLSEPRVAVLVRGTSPRSHVDLSATLPPIIIAASLDDTRSTDASVGVPSCISLQIAGMGDLATSRNVSNGVPFLVVP